MRKLYLPKLFLTLFAASFCVSSTVNPDSSYYFKITNTNFKNYIGYTSGKIIGNGFSYRRWFTSSTAFQFNTNALLKDYLDIGLTGLQSLKKYDPFRVVGYVSTKLARTKGNGYFSAGIGGGIEYYIGKMGSSLMLGISTPSGNGSSTIIIAPEIGMYLRF
jgi:hypothetical protein